MLDGGLATGVADAGLSSPVDGVHAYVNGGVPDDAAATSPTDAPGHNSCGCEARTFGSGNTVTCTAARPTQPLASVTVSVYAVDLSGLAVGSAIAGSLSPAAG